MKMTGKRVLIVLTFILMFGLMLQQCWQSKSPGEKWLYFFGKPAREYAGIVLGPGRGANVPVPENLGATIIVTHEDHLIFSPRQDPDLLFAFSPGGPPPADELQNRSWKSMGDSWYVLE